MIDFGYLFWQAVHFFHLDPERLLALPLRLFWSMTRHADRLRAAEDLRHLQVATMAAVSAQGGKEAAEASNNLHAALMEQMGTVIRHRERATPKEDILRIIQQLG